MGRHSDDDSDGVLVSQELKDRMSRKTGDSEKVAEASILDDLNAGRAFLTWRHPDGTRMTGPPANAVTSYLDYRAAEIEWIIKPPDPNPTDFQAGKVLLDTIKPRACGDELPKSQSYPLKGTLVKFHLRARRASPKLEAVEPFFWDGMRSSGKWPVPALFRRMRDARHDRIRFLPGHGDQDRTDWDLPFRGHSQVR